MVNKLDLDLWDAINEYAQACGGDTSGATASPRRMDAVVQVTKAVRAVSQAYAGGVLAEVAKNTVEMDDG